MIAIKDMKMPTDCYNCFLSASDCPISLFRHDGRADGCPLVEIVTCKDCKHCRFELVEGMPYYWCDKENRVTSEDFYCAMGESEVDT